MDSITQLSMFDQDVTKVCKLCGETKPLSEYYVVIPKTGCRRTWCKACDRERSRQWIQANKEYAYARSREYHREHAEELAAKRAIYFRENRQLVYARHNRYMAANPERRKAYRVTEDKERKRQMARIWAKAHPEERKAYSHKRRALLQGAGGAYTPAEWEALKAQYEYRCLMCGKQEPEIKLSVDHVIPVIEGGTNDIGNIQPLCMLCNFRKNRKIIDLRFQ